MFFHFLLMIKVNELYEKSKNNDSVNNRHGEIESTGASCFIDSFANKIAHHSNTEKVKRVEKKENCILEVFKKSFVGLVKYVIGKVKKENGDQYAAKNSNCWVEMRWCNAHNSI